MKAEEKAEQSIIHKARSTDWLFALGLFLLFTVLYWLTIAKDPTIDSFVTASWVKSISQFNWFHPHHLLFSYACRLVSLVYQTLFPPPDLLVLLTRCMHVLGGLAVALLYLRLYALNVSRLKAVSLALVIGVSYGMWFFSTIFELVMPYFLMFLAAWAAAHRWGQANRWGTFAAGMVLGAGVLIHQTLLIYLPAFLIFISMLGGHKSRWQRTLHYFIGCTAVVCAGYLTAFLVLGLDFPAGWLQFFTTYAQSEAFRHGTPADIVSSARYMAAIWSYPILYANPLSFRFMAAMVMLVAFTVAAIYRTTKKDSLSAFCLTVFATALIFFTWWAPDTLDFYLIPAVVILLPAFLLVRWKFFPAIILALAAWLFMFNNLPEMRSHNLPLFGCVMETDTRLARLLKPVDKVFFANQNLDACAAYLGIPGERNLVVEKLNHSEEIIMFAGDVKNAYDYAVYYDGAFAEMIRKTGLLERDTELASLMDSAREAVHIATCTQSLTMWKIQR